MTRRKKPYIGPIRVSKAPAGDALIDFLCEATGISREEAERRGRESMAKETQMDPITSKVPLKFWKDEGPCPFGGREGPPRPYRAPVGSIFFMDSQGNFDKEGWKEASAKADEDYFRRCKELGVEP